MPEVRISREAATKKTREFLEELAGEGWLIHVYYSRKKFHMEPVKSVESVEFYRSKKSS
jgi:hypothetical protein